MSKLLEEVNACPQCGQDMRLPPASELSAQLAQAQARIEKLEQALNQAQQDICKSSCVIHDKERPHCAACVDALAALEAEKAPNMPIHACTKMPENQWGMIKPGGACPYCGEVFKP